MSLHPNTQQTTERLQLALNSGQFHSELKSAGQKLLAHLRRPVQITVMGPKGAGKSSLISMILGAPEVMLPQSVAISEMIFGATPQTTFETAGNGISRQSGSLEQGDIPPGTVRVVQEMPLEQLKGKSLVEINLPSKPEQQKIILDWVIDTTNILIWCTQNFDNREAALWSGIPDRLKDHGMLVLTKADRLQLKGALSVQSARFEEELAEEFLGLFPVATKQATSARDCEAIIDADLWANSGGKALMDGIQRQINSGKMADLDQADLLLAKAANTSGAARTHDAETAPADAGPAKAKRPQEPEMLPRDEVLRRALDFFTDCGKDLRCPSDTAPKKADDILAQTLRASQGLNSILSQTADASLTVLKDNALECEQLILLLQLEKTDTAARDALTALLQMKKELVQESQI